jgi:hypothetical protein
LRSGVIVGVGDAQRVVAAVPAFCLPAQPIAEWSTHGRR